MTACPTCHNPAHVGECRLFKASVTVPRYCGTCGAAQGLHNMVTGACPTQYRPDTLAQAMRELDAAVLRKGAMLHPTTEATDRVFAARGEVQRHLGHRPGTCAPTCAGCTLLRVSEAH
jgi:hypothetical protein